MEWHVQLFMNYNTNQKEEEQKKTKRVGKQLLSSLYIKPSFTSGFSERSISIFTL